VVFDACSAIQICEGAVADLAGSLLPPQIREDAASRFRFPLQFDSLASEVSLLTLLHLVSFGSGYNSALQDACRSSWWECILFGVLGMHLAGQQIDSRFLSEFSDLQVNNFFRIPTHEDVESEIHPAIRLSRPGPLMPLARCIREQLNEAGSFLQGSGSQTLGEFVLSVMRESGTCSEAVEKLARSFPGFADCTGNGVAFYSKVQRLVAELCLCLAERDQQQLGFPDQAEMTASADSLLPIILLHLGVIKVV